MATSERQVGGSFLGRIPYLEALALQTAARAAIRHYGAHERLFLLEHPHVYTLGRNASIADLLVDPGWLAAHEVEVVECDRGGQMTYHGPGQLVGYPILNLSPDRRDIRRYVRDLQETLIRTLAHFGLAAEPRQDQALIGVWVGEEKIASIGIHLSRWITTHGFALNVTTDLSMFAGIVPCGLHSVQMTSIERLTGVAPTVEEVARIYAGVFAEVFERDLIFEPNASDQPIEREPPCLIPSISG